MHPGWESIRNSDHEQQLRDDGAYEIYICYATQGVSFYKTPFLYMFNDDLSMWGTCDLGDSRPGLQRYAQRPGG